MQNDKYDNIWCCASSWRPHKRLEENIRFFLEHSSKNDLLIVAGEVKPLERVDNPRIIYFGNLSQIQLYSLYKASKYFIHLSWLDHCPNVVVDARASGCIIICSNAGGTKEIAGEDAIIIKEEDWDFSPVELYNPPPLDFTNKTTNICKTNYDIAHTAQSYNSFLRYTHDREK